MAVGSSVSHLQASFSSFFSKMLSHVFIVTFFIHLLCL